MDAMFTRPETELSDFCDTVNSTICCADFVTGERQNSLSTRLEVVQLGPVNVFRYDGQGVRSATRSIRHVRANPVDDFLVFVPLSHSITLSQGKHQSEINPGSFGVLSSLRPYEVCCGDAPYHRYSELFAKVPGAMLRSHLPLMDEYCAMSVTGGHAGRLLNATMETILAEGHCFSEAQSRIFRSMLAEAIGVAALGAPETKAQHEALCLAGHAGVRAKAIDFVEMNLANPLLDAAMVAHACQVPLRQLHKAFVSSTTTVGALIRKIRMQRCRDDLRNPAMKGQSAIRIAMRWGFSSSASFTRSYHSHFGINPSDERRNSHSG
jgi:AraC-like DNA-binding protein